MPHPFHAALEYNGGVVAIKGAGVVRHLDGCPTIDCRSEAFRPELGTVAQNAADKQRPETTAFLAAKGI